MNPMGMMSGNGFNPMSLIKMIRSGSSNPMQMMNQMLGNNPQYQRVLQMVNGKSPREVQQIAMNLCEQRGINFNEALSEMRGMGLNVPSIENTPENDK